MTQRIGKKFLNLLFSKLCEKSRLISEISNHIYCVKMPDFGFPQTHIFPYKDRIYDSFLILKNTNQGRPVFSHILYARICRCLQPFRLCKNNEQYIFEFLVFRVPFNHNNINERIYSFNETLLYCGTLTNKNLQMFGNYLI